ncbi:MAG: Holliday junction resolvase RuvX [Bacteroidia bacterium]
MPRILAIDYGTKRCGLAVTDTLQIIAGGLGTVQTKDIITFLEDYFRKEEVTTIIIGQPRKLSGEETHATALSDAFAAQLAKKFPGKTIERIDERFTSKMAFQTMIDSGLKKKDRQKKETIDEIAAIIMLQDYMQRQG